MSEELCIECNGMINFYSESETYDYSEKDDGTIVYLCEECLNKLRAEAQ